jgi:ParB family chromosome partitioning protein
LQKKSGYCPVSGFRRIAACRNLKFEEIRARILDDGHDLLDCAQMAIAENSFQRELNLVEKSRALNILAHFLQRSSKIEKAAKALNLPANTSLIEKIRKIDRLPGSLQECLLNDSISMHMAFKLDRLEENEGSALLDIIKELRLSRNKQKELLTHIEEISIRDGLPIMQLVASEDVQGILKDDDLDRTQKTGNLRDVLRKRRFPHLYESERQFSDSLQELNLGGRISMKPPEYFEGNSFSVHLSFKDQEELDRHLKTLHRIKDIPQLANLINRK